MGNGEWTFRLLYQSWEEKDVTFQGVTEERLIKTKLFIKGGKTTGVMSTG